MHRIQQKVDNDRRNTWQIVRNDEYKETTLYADNIWIL